MWRTVKYKKNGSPLWDVNEQGVVYSYTTKSLIGKKTREENPYYATSDGDSTVYIHYLVVKAFPEICGELFEGCEIHHKDGNGLNNAPSNLIVCTHEEHLEYHRILKEEREKKAKKSIEERIAILKTHNKPIKVHYYCRVSKEVNKKSPIEISLYCNGERYFSYTGFYSRPSDFRQKKYPRGFKKYMKNIENLLIP